MKPDKPIKTQDALELVGNKVQASRRYAVSGLMVFIVLVLAASFIAFGTKTNTTNSKPSSLPPALVSITKQGFVPATVSIKPGQAVVWTNVSGTTHFLASDDPKPLTASEPIVNSQQNLNANDTFSYVFDKVGSYGYHDKDSRLSGTIIVR